MLATHPGIYYCGANWHPGEPAGGYCGVQHNSAEEKRTIFSIWDTSPTGIPVTTAADPETVYNSFGGESTGMHTHMLWEWTIATPFYFFLQKRSGKKPDTTDARYFIFDPEKGQWRHSATITSPNEGKDSVTTIGGQLNSFLENFTGEATAVPKIALYRLWLGKNLNCMQYLRKAQGDGTWGVLNDAYFLAEGDPKLLRESFATLEGRYGKAKSGCDISFWLAPISNKALPEPVCDTLKALCYTDRTTVGVFLGLDNAEKPFDDIAYNSEESI